ncbi:MULTISPECIES: DHH family phosphoesterase [unclassified Sporosarcina]|uniref:DHH family phosphoesterase n=1 Tax=unclassified Sporosarcina TaxID=2647733 RepID=UPI00057AE839|nr:DHH family phosphoesterase [Sporosarcina sp. ZBG7A]VDG89584.1 Bifunctional oligoribonuclease and PAP phosphatase nrnA [Lysinibacillus sphaericus]
MTSFFRRRAIRYPLAAVSLLGVLAAVFLFMFNFWIGLIYTVIFFALIGSSWKIEEQTYMDTEKHIETMSYRMKKVGEEALLELPIGIILLNDKQIIEWANPYAAQIFEEDSLIGEELFELAEQFRSFLKDDVPDDLTLTVGERSFRLAYKPEDRLIYLFDVTKRQKIESLYYADRTVIGILLVDNYDELAQTMDDQTRSQLNSLVTSLINSWGADNGIFVKRVASDRFLAVFNESMLNELEKSKFAILDDVREKTAKQSNGLTLSIGVGAGSPSLIELGELAQSSLDLVLGRGGDQVAIKRSDGKLKFFGGKTNPVEKRTRVRARVISHALRDLIQGSDQIFVMGHKTPDMDAIGAAIGVRKMARMNNVPGYVVVNFDELDASVNRLIDEIEQDPDLYDHFIHPDEVLAKMTDKSLVVIVDTHKPSMVIDERVIDKAEKLVVIDHHRRGEEFVQNTMLVYMEPYASSTAELVTELIEYQPKNEKLTMLESTAMLAGIVVDTKSFTLRTGSRTFEAASYLRTNGADTVLVQRLLKENIETYVERSRLIETVEIMDGGVAIAKGENGEPYNSVLIAQTADILLTMQGVSASFVIAPRSDGKIGISARSLGELNVQRVMEQLGGGGHLTNAATQLTLETVEEAEKQLKQVIMDDQERGE